jgi:multidrug resistance efflux pump
MDFAILRYNYMNRKTIVLILICLIVPAAALGFFWPFGQRQSTLVLPGVVEIQEVRLGSKIGGRVESVDVQEGARVEVGKVLVTFAVPELRAQEQQQVARLQQVEADLEKARNGPRTEEKAAARQAVEAARAKWEMLKVGYRQEEIREAKSMLESAQADLKLCREDYDRARKLYEQNSFSRADYDAALAKRRHAEGDVARTQARFDMLSVGNRPEEVQQAAADLKRAQANYDLLLAGTRSEDLLAAEARLAEARGKLKETEANLQEATVVAPDTVVVDVVSVRKGDLVPPNTPILRVLRAVDLWVKVYVPETELGKVRLNDEVEVTVDAYPGLRFQGKVMHIESASEFTPRNVQSADERRHQVFGIKVQVLDPQGIFKSGMAAEVTLPLR